MPPSPRCPHPAGAHPLPVHLPTLQVSTRFLSTCPPWYWWAAHLVLQGRRRSAWIWAYCWLYMALGAALFPNFMPWT